MSVLSPPEETDFTIEPQPSGFTYDDLAKLNNKSTSCLLKLAVIGHVDLNAFFAQVEQVRLNLSIDDPVVCVQWQAVIAVSYAARKFGINRMDTVVTCRQKCPEVVLAHAAVYEKGSANWKYLEKLPFQGNCKVSLDPYRRESRKIFKILAKNCDLIEKGSVDEGFLDLGRLIYHRLTETFPYLKNGTGPLPNIPKDIDYKFKGKVYKSDDQTQLILRDWDDVISLIGSNIIYDIRKEIYDQLGYTTSAGLSNNKNMAKLAGGFLKPDNQTILLNEQIPNFLKNFEVIDISGMGGKYGESILSDFNIPSGENSIQYLLKFSEQDLNESHPNLYQIIRGDYAQHLRDRIDVKSMMSRKQLMNNHPIKTLFDSFGWIKTFVGDIRNRLNDLDEEKGTLNRPKTVSVNVIIHGKSHSKQCSLTVFKEMKKLEKQLMDFSLKLLIELTQDLYNLETLNNGKPDLINIDANNKVNIPPISNMAVIVSSLIRLDNSLDLFTSGKKADKELFKEFEMEQKLKNMSKDEDIPPKAEGKLDKSYINNLFAKFEEEKQKEDSVSPRNEQPSKRTKLDKDYINGLFEKFNQLNSRSSPPPNIVTPPKIQSPPKKKNKYNIVDILKQKKSSSPTIQTDSESEAISLSAKDSEPDNYCKECNETITDEAEHRDFHLALELSKQIQ